MDHGFVPASFDDPRAKDFATPSRSLNIRAKEICILWTSNSEARPAVRIANGLANAMAASLTVINFRATGEALRPDLPLGDPNDEITAFVEQLRAEGMTVNIRRYVCRDVHQAIPFAFSPHSLIVLGGRRSWFPTRAERLRRALETAGHFVVFVDGTTS